MVQDLRISGLSGHAFHRAAHVNIGTVVKRLKLYNKLIDNVMENCILAKDKRIPPIALEKFNIGGISKINLHAKV